MKTIIRALFAVGAASTLLEGCAVYAPSPVYGGDGTRTISQPWSTHNQARSM
jgi:hypothetical protein